jgi:hypothetical protein
MARAHPLGECVHQLPSEALPPERLVDHKFLDPCDAAIGEQGEVLKAQHKTIASRSATRRHADASSTRLCSALRNAASSMENEVTKRRASGKMASASPKFAERIVMLGCSAMTRVHCFTLSAVGKPISADRRSAQCSSNKAIIADRGTPYLCKETRRKASGMFTISTTLYAKTACGYVISHS